MRAILKCAKCEKLYHRRIKTKHPKLCYYCNKALSTKERRKQ